MRIIRLSSLTALALAGGLLSQADATVVPIQKGKASVCSAVWDTGVATATPGANPKQPWTLTCADGNPDCDSDGVQNGSCTVEVNGCAFADDVAGCTPEPLTRLAFNGVVRNKLLGFLPVPTGGGVAVCGTPGRIVLPLKKNGQRPSKKFALVANVRTASGKGKNVLRVQCTPPAGGSTFVCPDTVSGQPKQITFTVPAEGDDLDTGFSGLSHNFPVVEGSELKYCLTNCDGTADTTCDASGDTGANTLNGETFGAPLPLLSANTPVCVINRYQPGPVTGSFDLATGQGESLVRLFSDVYLRSGLGDEVCPRCGSGPIGSSGRCSGTATNAGAACRVNGLGRVESGSPGRQDYSLSSDCNPTGELVGSLDIQLPMTTGTTSSPAQPNPGCPTCPSKPCPGQTQDDNCGGSSCSAQCTGSACVRTNAQGQCIDAKGGISQLCCAGNTSLPCFPTGSGQAITRTGSPVVPGTPAGGVFAANFCIPAAGGIVSAVAGLPGPGALLLPAVGEVTNTP
jgi:hypothetical protein